MDRIILLSRLLIFGQLAAAISCFIILAKMAKTKAKERQQSKPAAESREEPSNLLTEVQFNSLQNELNETKADYAKLQNEIKDLEKGKSQDNLLRKENAELRNKLASKEQELGKIIPADSLKDELGKLKADYATAQNEIQASKRENAELKDKLADKEEERGKIAADRSTVEKELKKKIQELQLLEKENKETADKLKNLEAQVEALKHPPVPKEAPKEEAAQAQKPSKLTTEQKRGKIGEILLAHNFITKDILDKALKHKEEFGGNITQYLLAYGYIDERQLAQCLCTQFAIPYLPLSSYKIPDEIIKLVPVDIAQKYWLIPMEKIGNLLTVVMADPLDTRAIKVIEEITGCGVQPFVGILSEIIEALENYYRVVITGKELKSKTTQHAPFFINTETYKGPERRDAVRFKAKIDVHFPVEGYYKKSQTKDVSRGGFLMDSEAALSMGSIIPLQVDLPGEFSPVPIATIVQVIRVIPLEDNRFEIGVKIIKISREEIDTILKYASTHEVK